MEENFNKLTPAETERLAWLIEECGEVIQCGTKILRHGYASFDPSDPSHFGNRKHLEDEIIDLMLAIGCMILNNDISEEYITPVLESPVLFKAKMEYMHHQQELEV